MFWKGVPEEGDLILERQSWLHRLEDKRDSEETLDGGGGGAPWAVVFDTVQYGDVSTESVTVMGQKIHCS
jgi:hypothetical protein